MKKWFFSSIIISLFLVITLSGCSGGGSSGEGNNARPIKDAYEAKSIAEDVNRACDQVQSLLPAVYNQDHNYVLSNQRYDSSSGGHAIVNGTSVRDFNSSYSSVSDTLTIHITIIFNDWIVQNTSSGLIKLSGPIDYYYNKWSQTTSGGSYSSSLSKTIKNSEGQKITTVHNISSNIKDSILINVSDYNDNLSMVTGTVTGANGTFTF